LATREVSGAIRTKSSTVVTLGAVGDRRPLRVVFVTGIGAIWHVGSAVGVDGPGLEPEGTAARDPRCTLTVALREFDLVVNSEAHLVTDPPSTAVGSAHAR
jgi:hypothetical protein